MYHDIPYMAGRGMKRWNPAKYIFFIWLLLLCGAWKGAKKLRVSACLPEAHTGTWPHGRVLWHVSVERAKGWRPLKAYLTTKIPKQSKSHRFLPFGTHSFISTGAHSRAWWTRRTLWGFAPLCALSRVPRKLRWRSMHRKMPSCLHSIVARGPGTGGKCRPRP